MWGVYVVSVYVCVWHVVWCDPEEVVLECLRILARKFGTSTNNKGYNVLNPAIRVIQGDGVNPDSIRNILRSMTANGFSTDNIAFGMGAGLLQNLNRDTLGFAMKCSAIKVRGEVGYRLIYKEPVTDAGKYSKRGRMSLLYHEDTGKYETYPCQLKPDYGGWAGIRNMMRPIFRDGELLVSNSLAQIRDRAHSFRKEYCKQHHVSI